MYPEIKRMPAVAGSFYPSVKKELTGMVRNFLDASKPENLPPSSEIIAVLAPHAGYIYSGLTAAYSYKTIERANSTSAKKPRWDTVILVGNSHNFYLGKAAVFPAGSFITPLGEIEVDKELAVKIFSNKKYGNLFEPNPKAHEPEHSLEVQLPFIQMALGDKIKILPILLSGAISYDNVIKIGEALGETTRKYSAETGKKILLVASSDMSHFPTDEVAREADGEALEAIKTMDPMKLVSTTSARLRKNLNGLECVLCGEEAVVAVMTAAKNLGADEAKVLHYSNSSDASGDKSRVVGYGSVVFLKNSASKGSSTTMNFNKGKKNPAGKSPGGDDFSISPKNQKILLALARKAIVERIRAKDTSPSKNDFSDEELMKPAAVFVTLTTKPEGMLRGCIGTTQATMPLYKAVWEMAQEAATGDPRFAPVSDEKELDKIKIEISVLSPLKRATSADEIIPDVHGVVVRRGIRGGLFLPQVWEHFHQGKPEQRKADFLGELCYQKAGLPRDAWREPATELYIFTVFKFEE